MQLLNENREDLFSGKFTIGSNIQDASGKYEVLDIGANYLTVIAEDSTISKKWVDKVSIIEDKLEIDYFKSDTIPNNIKELFIESLNDYYSNKFEDKLALVTAWKKLDEFYTTQNIELLSKIENIMEKINQIDRYKDLLEMQTNIITVSDEEKLEAARIFAETFGVIDENNTPEELVNAAIVNFKESELTSDSVVNMLEIIKHFNINYDEKLLEDESVTTSDYKIGKDGRKIKAHRIVFYKDKKDVAEEVDHLDPAPNYSDNEQIDNLHIDHSEKSEDELNALSDEDLDILIGTCLTDDDYYEDYPEDQLTVIDLETGKEVEPEINESLLNEVLSRMERLRARIRFHRSEAKRERKLHIALMKKSDTQTITHRARRLAVKALELKLAKKPLNTLSVSEKERIEQRVQKSKPILNRLTIKLISKVRKLEQARLHQG